ncbi:thioredoxin-like protein [Mycotypha africana]|uniref:thioredoxin-like protein n=1 Tax=Mycotypha africana TaxID=64632 RepID=UPI00230122EF|nr:thioredoxin-like protein [Mycotypha africana]KAI8979358.1 thioredoxin-like protein [Mycotypha africana]
MNPSRTIANKALRPIARSFHTTHTRLTGKTVEATTSTFDSLVTKADHPVIVDFYADWCGPCKMLGPLLTKTVAANPKVTLVKINVDDHQEVAAKYKIAALPTVSAFYNGKVVDSFVGMRNGPTVEEFVKKHAELA